MKLSALGGHTDWLSNVPATQFELPVFGKEGYTVFKLSGQEGIIKSPELIEVHGMVLRTYDGEKSAHLTAMLESPLAYFYPKAHKANGPGFLSVTSARYSLVGRSWEWSGSLSGNSTIIIKETVKVTFKEKFPTLNERLSYESA